MHQAQALKKLWARQEYEPERAWVALEKNGYGAEERVRMLAALADGEALEKVMRYEAHLAQEFARTLEQLEKARVLGIEKGPRRRTLRRQDRGFVW